MRRPAISVISLSLFIFASASFSAESKIDFSPLQKQIHDQYTDIVEEKYRNNPDTGQFNPGTNILLSYQATLWPLKSPKEAIKEFDDNIWKREKKALEKPQYNVKELTGSPHWKEEALKQFFPGDDVEVSEFCTAFKNYYDSLEAGDTRYKRCKRSFLEMLEPLPEYIQSVPIYLVWFTGNHHGDFDYVKLYIGKTKKTGPWTFETTNIFLVIDGNVYSHI